MPATEPERPAAVADDAAEQLLDGRPRCRRAARSASAATSAGRQPASSPLPRRCRSATSRASSSLGEQRRRGVQLGADGVSVAEVVGAAAGRARPMACGQRDGVIEEEDRGPAAWRRPADVASPRNDVRQTIHNALPWCLTTRTVVVDEAAPVAREQSPCGIGVEVTPRVDAIPAWHVTRAGRSLGGGDLGVLAGDDPPAVGLLGHHVGRAPLWAVLEGLSVQVDGSLPHRDHGDVGSARRRRAPLDRSPRSRASRRAGPVA